MVGNLFLREIKKYFFKEKLFIFVQIIFNGKQVNFEEYKEEIPQEIPQNSKSELRRMRKRRVTKTTKL